MKPRPSQEIRHPATSTSGTSLTPSAGARPSAKLRQVILHLAWIIEVVGHDGIEARVRTATRKWGEGEGQRLPPARRCRQRSRDHQAALGDVALPKDRNKPGREVIYRPSISWCWAAMGASGPRPHPVH